MSAHGNSARDRHAREVAFDRLGAMVRAAESGEVSERVSLAGRERLLKALAQPAKRSNVTRVAWGSAGALVAAAAAVALVFQLRHAPSVPGWTTENAVAAEDGYVTTARPDANATLRFTSGASIELTGGSRGRVVDATAGHARLVLEAGRATVHGAHPQLSFMIQAGPFALVGDRDASFDVAWTGDTLDVHVASGAVKVDGPSAQGLALHGDQHLVTTVSDGGLRVDRTSAENEAPVASPADMHGAADDSPTLPESDASPAVSASGPHAASQPQAHSASWSQRVAAGEYDIVLREADARGLDSAVRKGSLADVSALADAARYAGRIAVAKRALSSERSRFAGSSEARTAAFLLGRIAEDSDGDTGAAIGWYDRYLAEAPKGPLASEALGRKMLLVARTSGADAAKPFAAQYLRRFPSGSYATVARQYATP